MFSTFNPNRMPTQIQARIDSAGTALIFGLFGPLAFFAPKGLWIPLLLLLLFRLKLFTSIEPGSYRRILVSIAVYLLLPLYTLCSAAWALVPGNAVVSSARLLGYILAASAVVVVVDRLSDADKRLVFIWAAAGLSLASLAVWIDLATAGALSDLFRRVPFTANQYSRGAAVSACAVLPIAVGLHRSSGSWSAIVFAGITVATVFVLDNEAAKLVAVSAVVVYGVVWWRRGLFWPVILLPLAFGVLSPVIFGNALSNSQLCTVYNIKPSAAHRLVIYEFSSRKISEKPIFGWGMDASRSIPGGNGVVNIQDCRYKQGRATTQRLAGMIPLHPHNAALQIWLELGAVGVAAFVGLLWPLISRWQGGLEMGHGRPLIAGLFCAVFLVYNISFGLWQAWLIFALILLCAITRAVPVDVSPVGRSTSR